MSKPPQYKKHSYATKNRGRVKLCKIHTSKLQVLEQCDV